MRTRDKERRIKKAQRQIEEALSPLPICCQKRIMKAVVVLFTDAEIKRVKT